MSDQPANAAWVWGTPVQVSGELYEWPTGDARRALTHQSVKVEGTANQRIVLCMGRWITEDRLMDTNQTTCIVCLAHVMQRNPFPKVPTRRK